MRTVYADVVLLVNFFIDAVILYMCAYIYKIRVKKTKLAVSSLLGAFYALFVAVFNICYAFSFLLGLLVSIFMLKILFGKRSKRIFLRLTTSFYIIAFLMCAFMEVSFSLIVSYFKGGVPVWILFTCAGALMLSCMVFSRGIGGGFARGKVVMCVQTQTAEKEYTLLCDSGNLLHDPFSNLPVVILGKYAQDELVGTGGTYNSYIENHLRYIPVSTAFGSGVIKGIKPKKVRVKNDKSEYREVDVIIAFSPNEKNEFGGNDGVIPQSVIEMIN